MPLHKSVIGLAGSLVPGLQTVTEGVGLVRGLTGGLRERTIKTRKPARKTIPRELTARISPGSEGSKVRGRALKFPETFSTTEQGLGITVGGVREKFDFLGITDNGNGGNGCEPPLIMSPRGNCIAPTSPRGAELFAQQPIAGVYGAGFIPGTRLVDVAQCGKKQVLGDDGICYSKTQISNKQRMWPKGRRPLLTGGDMRAISIASRAGKRMDSATTRLRKLGMMKAAPKPRAAPKPHAHAVPAAAVSV